MATTVTTTEPTPNEGDTRQVYVLQVKEVTSYDYRVPARSFAEAVRLYKEDPFEYKDYNSSCYHDEYKPTLDYKYTEVYTTVNRYGFEGLGNWRKLKNDDHGVIE